METHELKGVVHYLGLNEVSLALLVDEPAKTVKTWLEGEAAVPEFAGFILRHIATGVRKAVMEMKKVSETKNSRPLLIVFDKYEDTIRFRPECDETMFLVNSLLAQRVGELTNAETITFNFESFMEFSEDHPVDFDEDGLMEWASKQVA